MGLLPKGSRGWGVQAGSPQTPSLPRAPLSAGTRSAGAPGCPRRAVQCVVCQTRPLRPPFRLRGWTAPSRGDNRSDAAPPHAGFSPTSLSDALPDCLGSGTPGMKQRLVVTAKRGDPAWPPGALGRGDPGGHLPRATMAGLAGVGGHPGVGLAVSPRCDTAGPWGDPQGSRTPNLPPNPPGCHRDPPMGRCPPASPLPQRHRGTLGRPPSSVTHGSAGADGGTSGDTEGHRRDRHPCEYVEQHSLSPPAPPIAVARSPCTVAMGGSHCLRTQHPRHGPLARPDPPALHKQQINVGEITAESWRGGTRGQACACV